jgi:hypothetical protein
MPMNNSHILLPQTYYQRDLYDVVIPTAPMTVKGIPQLAAGYYNGCQKTQTVSWSVINLDAKIEIQATIITEPTETDWVSIHTINAVKDEYNVGLTEATYVNLTGSYVKIRAKVTNFTQGSIEHIKVAY